MHVAQQTTNSSIDASRIAQHANIAIHADPHGAAPCRLLRSETRNISRSSLVLLKTRSSAYLSSLRRRLTDEVQTQLPDEYIDLEKRVDALKLVHQKLLEVT
jgi:hypothetical protein